MTIVTKDGPLSVTVLGAVQSGKTTYFAALWWLLNNQSHDCQYGLSIESLKGNREHLNKLSDRWQEVKIIEHTDTNDWQNMIFHLKHNESGKQITLHLPDLPGEYIEYSLMFRKWKTQLNTYLEDSHGLLLFINVNKVVRPAFLEEFLRYTEDEVKPDSGEEFQVDTESWEPNIKKVPMDVYLTDLLQQLRYKFPERIFTLSIILTGWDEITRIQSLAPHIAAVDGEPDLWMKRSLPLLEQFLQSNIRFFKFQYYGMSAYGGEQNIDSERDRIKNIEPHHRVLVNVNGMNENDISLPLLPFFNL